MINWNHIHKNINKEDELELKAYYMTYHRKCWAYKKAFKKYKKLKYLGNTISLLTASGGIISVIITSGVALIAISGVALVIKTYMEHQNLEVKINNCQYAFQNYNHIMDTIKTSLRSGIIDKNELIIEMEHLDKYIIDNSPIVDKYFKEYDKKFQLNKTDLSSSPTISSTFTQNFS